MAFTRLKTLRQPEPVEEPTQRAAPEPTTIAEVEQLLADLDRRRDECLTSLGALPGRERELIEQDAGDDAFDALDASKRHLERTLVRLGIVEQRLLARAGELQARNRQAEWGRLTTAYHEAVAAFLAAYKEEVRLREQVETVSREAAELGFGLGRLSILPPPPRIFDPHVVEGFAAAARDVGQRPPPPPGTPMNTVTVSFIRSWHVYMTGDRAGFSPERAKLLADAGIAEIVGTNKRASLIRFGE